MGTTRGLAASAIRGRRGRERWRQGLAHVNINIMPRANDQNDSSATQNTQITQTACRLLRTFNEDIQSTQYAVRSTQGPKPLHISYTVSV